MLAVEEKTRNIAVSVVGESQNVACTVLVDGVEYEIPKLVAFANDKHKVENTIASIKHTIETWTGRYCSYKQDENKLSMLQHLAAAILALVAVFII